MIRVENVNTALLKKNMFYKKVTHTKTNKNYENIIIRFFFFPISKTLSLNFRFFPFFLFLIRHIVCRTDFQFGLL